MQQEPVRGQGMLLQVLMAVVPPGKCMSSSLARTQRILTNHIDDFLLERGPASGGW